MNGCLKELRNQEKKIKDGTVRDMRDNETLEFTASGQIIKISR